MGHHDYRDEEDRVMTVRAEIDEARRRGKRSYLRGLPASGFTVADVALLLDEGSVYQQRMACHVLTARHEEEYDRMMTAQVGYKFNRDLMLSPWEVATNHRRTPCRTHCSDSCSNCNLYICSICGGSEGSLLPFCPNRKLTADEDSRHYAHYCARSGPFAKPTWEDLAAAKDACYERLSDRATWTAGSEQLYHAVWNLWNYTPAGPLV